ncbi:MAG: hypothetical protein PHY23_00075 [Oscillospiraceae bacterium]|nr:hypothetical protein [Oscillospiraceae bacterium]
MNDYVFTLTATSVKEVEVSAHNFKEAGQLVQQMIRDTDVLNFCHDDVTAVDIVGESADSECGGCCEACDLYCEVCGSCLAHDCETCEEEDCEGCKWRCPECGGCGHPDVRNQ